MSDEQQENILQIKKYANQGLFGSVKKLYLEAKSSDVKFLFGSNDSTSTAASVVAHKSLLAAGSDVFDAMFYGDLKEPDDVHVPDSTDAAFTEFLQFFYLTEVELTEENIAGVMYLGHKYYVTECINVCNQFLTDICNAENVLMVLDLAITYDDHELLKMCEKLIILDTAAQLESVSFWECDKKVLAHILRMDLLSCSEIELFEACMSWVKTQSGQDVVSREMVETHLGNAYYQIRFASMTTENLCILTEENELVLQSDFMTITKMIAMSQYEPLKFNSSPRQIKWNADAAIECSFKNGNDQEHDIYREESIKFSTDEPLLLGAFTCGKIVRKKVENGDHLELSSDLTVDVDVLETTDLNEMNSKVLLKMKTHLQSADTKVMLSRPVLIRPGFFYKISLGPFPDDHVFYSELLTTEMTIQSNISIELHECVTANTPDNDSTHGKAIGLIWTLDFNNI